MFKVGVAPGAFVTKTRFVILLFVRVLVELIVGTSTPSTAITPAADLDTVVSVLFPKSIVPN